MEAGRLARWRWRRSGAWMWPAFIALTLFDGVSGHVLPVAGDGQDFIGAALIGCFANLFGIVVLAWPVSLVVRRRRPGLPRVVARDRAGTLVMAGLAALILIAGWAHHSTLASQRSAEREAIARAQAYIGARAPDQFRRNAEYVYSFAIEPGRIYRECVASAFGGRREYCVIVKTQLPFASSVSFAGSEPNVVFSQGTQ